MTVAPEVTLGGFADRLVSRYAAASTDREIRKLRAWLAALDLLDRPWLVLGSAPSPTLPSEIGSYARIDINNAGSAAAALGLGRADLTIRAKTKSWTEHDQLDTRGLLWVHSLPARVLPMLLLGKPYRHIGCVTRLRKMTRERMVMQVSSVSVENIGDRGKVSNGVAAICCALTMGVPKVVVAGISLRKTGHSHDQLGRKRLQVEEDAIVLRALSRHGRVFTTEPELAEDTGIAALPVEPTDIAGIPVRKTHR